MKDLFFKNKDNDLNDIKRQIKKHEDRLNTHDKNFEYIQESDKFSIEERKRRVEGSIRHLEKLKNEQYEKVRAAECQLERTKEELVNRQALAISNAMSFKNNSPKKLGFFSRKMTSTNHNYEKETVKESANSKVMGVMKRIVAKFK
jgi:hypothetical protein